MNRYAIRIPRFLLVLTVSLALAPAARGATLYAANNGVDLPTCGASASPCRSITRAMANAADGDTIQVRAGRYGADNNDNGVFGEPGEEVPSFGGMLTIAKPLIILSTDGAAATVIDARNVPSTVAANTNVLIITGNAEFGRPGHGFTVTNPGTQNGGIAAQGTNLKIRGNQVINLGGNGLRGTGIGASGPAVVLVEENSVIGWAIGIEIGGSAETASKNQVLLCNTGIGAIEASVVGNVVAGSNYAVFLAFSAGATGNAIEGNRVGVFLQESFRGVVQKNNIFGSSECGLYNDGVLSASAAHNFWGAPTGPGGRPADGVCNTAGTTTITSPFATTRFTINPSFDP